MAILVTVDVFGLSHLLGDSRLSTVTAISGVRVAILVTELLNSRINLEVEKVFLLSAARSCLQSGAMNMSGGVGGRAATPICKTSNSMAKRYVLLSLAKLCLLRSCPKSYHY